MNKEITSDQERLQQLQETSFFSELSSGDKTFVLKQTTAELFDQVHITLTESKNLYAIPNPKALNLPYPNSQQNRFRAFLIPLTSAAAAALITFFFFKRETIVFRNVDNPVLLTADTVYVPQITPDTIIKEVYVKGKTIIVNRSSVTEIVELSPISVGTEVLPPISLVNLKNKGQSTSEDKTIALMEGVEF